MIQPDAAALSKDHNNGGSTVSVSIKTAISEVIAEIESITTIKQEQEYALVDFFCRKDVSRGFSHTTSLAC